MVDDPKVQFYLTLRELIQEWAALADPAAQALEQALLGASNEFAASAGGDLPVPRISPGGTTFIRLDITTALYPGCGSNSPGSDADSSGIGLGRGRHFDS